MMIRMLDDLTDELGQERTITFFGLFNWPHSAFDVSMMMAIFCFVYIGIVILSTVKFAIEAKRNREAEAKRLVSDSLLNRRHCITLPSSFHLIP